MTIDLFVKNGRILTPYGFYEGSISVDSGRILSLSRGSSAPHADRVVDAGGRLVLPGMIDMHVHLRDPGFTEREDFETGTKGAAAGGVTIVADMPNTTPSVTTVEALREKIAIAERKSVVDFALVGGAGEVSPEDLIGMAEVGVVGFKTFMIARFKELAASDGQMLENFKVIAGTGLPCLIHAENEDLVARGIARARELGRLDPLAHCEFRPPVAEVEATTRTMLLAGETEVHLHICHMTAKGAVEALRWAKSRGRRVTGETSPNYLMLNDEAMTKVGPIAKIDPPLRKPADQEALWDAVKDGTMDVLASDHAPYPREEKEKGWKDIFEAPSGGTGVETSLALMLDNVHRGRISIQRLSEMFSANPARIMKLYPRKGALLPGSDADIVIVDMDMEYEIKGEDLQSKQKVTAFEGYRGRGKPVTTIVRGEIVMEDGLVTGRSGYGEFLRPIT